MNFHLSARATESVGTHAFHNKSIRVYDAHVRSSFHAFNNWTPRKVPPPTVPPPPSNPPARLMLCIRFVKCKCLFTVWRPC